MDDRNDVVVKQILPALGNGGSRELAERIYDKLRDDGRIQFADRRGLHLVGGVDLLAEAEALEAQTPAAQTLDVYEVDADAVTGEWLGDPAATGETVPAAEWHARCDTDTEHFDTYEYFPIGETGSKSCDSVTRAIIVRYVS